MAKGNIHMMNTILVFLLMFQADPVDVAKAKAAAAAAIERANCERANKEPAVNPAVEPDVAPPPEPIPADEPLPPAATPARSVSVEWITPPPKAAAVPLLHLVSESWCGPCQQRKKALTDEGRPFKVVTLKESLAMGLPLKKNASGNYEIPQEFMVDPPKQAAPDVPVVAIIDDEDATTAALIVLARHLDYHEAGEAPPVSGMMDLDIQTADVLPQLLNDLVMNGRWENAALGIFASWPGNRTLNVNDTKGTITITPPVQLMARRSIFKLRAGLQMITISENGRRLDLSLDGAPDLTIRLKGSQPTAAETMAPELLTPRPIPQVNKAPPAPVTSVVPGFNRDAEIAHLMDPRTIHGGRHSFERLRRMTDMELIQLHNREHGYR